MAYPQGNQEGDRGLSIGLAGVSATEREPCLPLVTVLGRALIIQARHVLLAHEVLSPNTHLPGGHVRHGESVLSAIRREIREEFGDEAVPFRYVGSVEHSFDDQGRVCHEINHVFLTELSNIRYPERPSSKEGHLEFYWWPQERLQGPSVNLLPKKLIELCGKFLRTGESGYWLTEM